MENNFEIENVTSIDEAFKKLQKHTFDAVISDYEMPQKNGLDFLKELREQKNDIAFILFTGKGREDVAVKALNLGADRYIDKNGSPETVYCELAYAINKIVERKKSRELLAKSEAKYRTLVEKSLQGISILQAAPLRIVFANEAMGKLMGYSSQDLMGLSPEGIMGLVYHEDRAVFFKRMENRLRGEMAEACFEFRAVRKDGSLIWLSSLANRVDYDGQPAVQGMFLDVSESKKASEILIESEARYRELANCLPESVFETNLNGQLVFANERATEISGYSLSEIEGLNVMQFIAPEDRERARKNIQVLLTDGSHVPTEYTFVRKDGTTFPTLITTTPRIHKNKLNGFRGIVLDITERKKTEESLEKERKELNHIIDSSPIIIFYKDKGGKFLRVNQAFAEAQKIPKENFCGKTVFDFFSAEIAQGMANDDLEVLESGCPKLGIIEHYESASGMKWVQTDKVPILDKNGVSTGLMGFAQDITERKEAEEALNSTMNKLVLVNEKLNVVGSLTRHDVCNKLSIITAYTYLLKKKHADQIEILEGLGKIEQTVKDAGTIFDFAKMYEQLGVEELAYVDTEKVLDEARALFPDLKAKVINDCQGLTLLADSFLRQLFYNFIDNTRKYGKKTATIRIYYEKADEANLRLIYEDDGVGISAENKLKLFTEGFSSGGSTGLGCFWLRR
jgi:PAS domain S-box-containing protein